jgi:hypothetical protein
MVDIVVSSVSNCVRGENRLFPFIEMPTASSREKAVPGSTNSRRAARRVAVYLMNEHTYMHLPSPSVTPLRSPL